MQNYYMCPSFNLQTGLQYRKALIHCQHAAIDGSTLARTFARCSAPRGFHSSQQRFYLCSPYDEDDEPDRPSHSGSGDRPSRSGGSYSGVVQYEREDPPPDRRRSLGGAADPLSVTPPTAGSQQRASKVKELAAQFREKELESPTSSGGGSPGGSQGDKPQPRFQVNTDRYVGRGLDRREVPFTGRPSLDLSGSNSTQKNDQGSYSQRGLADASSQRGGGDASSQRAGGDPSLQRGGDFGASQRGVPADELRSFSASKLRTFRSEPELLAELERREVEIEGLRAQSESWQRSAKSYAAENEQLRGEMKVQIQYTDEAGAEADEAARERDEARVRLLALIPPNL